MRKSSYGAGGGTIAWAVRQAIGWAAVALALYFLASHRDRPWSGEAAPKPAAAAGPAMRPVLENTLVYRTNAQGHVRLEGAVNGAIVPFVVDTGATLVTLTLRDAEAAGISPGELDFSMPLNTANGGIRAAPVTLREVRLGQLALDDVQAAVVPNLSISLLGMSFLSRLDRWDMRDGALTITY